MLLERDRIQSSTNLDRSLGPVGCEEYGRLVRVARASVGRFAVLPVESNLPATLRDTFLWRLAGDLLNTNAILKIVRLTHDDWNLMDHIRDVDESVGNTVVAVVGLENTPALVVEGGRKLGRPPAIAALNVAREALRQRVKAPLIVWCEPWIYSRLQEFAPDFFDHYTALFTYVDSAPEPRDTTRYSAYMSGMFATIGSRIAEESSTGSESAVAFYEEILSQDSIPTTERINALLGLADSLAGIRGKSREQQSKRAEMLAREALSLTRSCTDVELRARARANIGRILLRRQHTLPLNVAEVNQANRFLTQALSFYTREAHPFEWAKATFWLGEGRYRRFWPDVKGSEKDKARYIKRFITCCESTAQILTEGQYPVDWARIQHNLGWAFNELRTEGDDDNLMKATACFEAALRVRTEEQYPIEWAITQHGLGWAYGLRSGNRDENLMQAIACFEAALRVRMEERYPLDWASTTHALGRVYSELRTVDTVGNIKKAVACYHSVLRVWTKELHPKKWVEIQDYLGRARTQLMQLQETCASR